MDTTTLTASNGTATIARPLKVLIPLIKQDLADGYAAANRAGLPFYQAAGEKLLEARTQIPASEFAPWLQRTFTHVKVKQLRLWMSYAEHVGGAGAVAPFTSLNDFLRQTTQPNRNHSFVGKAVKQIVAQLDIETLNADLKRADEREAERKLALQVIDIGYKILARELHPDKGGSREAMARLNAVRTRLKGSV